MVKQGDAGSGGGRRSRRPPPHSSPPPAVSTNRVARVREMHAAHSRYCARQLENDKTTQVLRKAFGEEVAGAYMREAMFDCEPLPEGLA